MQDTGDAVRARTSVDRARVGELTTYARHPSGQRTTSVDLEGRPDGSVDVRLPTGAEAVAQLLARPLATLHVAPAWSWVLRPGCGCCAGSRRSADGAEA